MTATPINAMSRQELLANELETLYASAVELDFDLSDNDEMRESEEPVRVEKQSVAVKRNQILTSADVSRRKKGSRSSKGHGISASSHGTTVDLRTRRASSADSLSRSIHSTRSMSQSRHGIGERSHDRARSNRGRSSGETRPIQRTPGVADSSCDGGQRPTSTGRSVRGRGVSGGGSETATRSESLQRSERRGIRRTLSESGNADVTADSAERMAAAMLQASSRRRRNIRTAGASNQPIVPTIRAEIEGDITTSNESDVMDEIETKKRQSRRISRRRQQDQKLLGACDMDDASHSTRSRRQNRVADSSSTSRRVRYDSACRSKSPNSDKPLSGKSQRESVDPSRIRDQRSRSVGRSNSTRDLSTGTDHHDAVPEQQSRRVLRRIRSDGLESLSNKLGLDHSQHRTKQTCDVVPAEPHDEQLEQLKEDDKINGLARDKDKANKQLQGAIATASALSLPKTDRVKQRHILSGLRGGLDFTTRLATKTKESQNSDCRGREFIDTSLQGEKTREDRLGQPGTHGHYASDTSKETLTSTTEAATVPTDDSRNEITRKSSTLKGKWSGLKIAGLDLTSRRPTNVQAKVARGSAGDAEDYMNKTSFKSQKTHKDGKDTSMKWAGLRRGLDFTSRLSASQHEKKGNVDTDTHITGTPQLDVCYAAKAAGSESKIEPLSKMEIPIDCSSHDESKKEKKKGKWNLAAKLKKNLKGDAKEVNNAGTKESKEAVIDAVIDYGLMMSMASFSDDALEGLCDHGEGHGFGEYSSRSQDPSTHARLLAESLSQPSMKFDFSDGCLQIQHSEASMDGLGLSSDMLNIQDRPPSSSDLNKVDDTSQKANQQAQNTSLSESDLFGGHDSRGSVTPKLSNPPNRRQVFSKKLAEPSMRFDFGQNLDAKLATAKSAQDSIIEEDEGHAGDVHEDTVRKALPVDGSKMENCLNIDISCAVKGSENGEKDIKVENKENTLVEKYSDSEKENGEENDQEDEDDGEDQDQDQEDDDKQDPLYNQLGRAAMTDEGKKEDTCQLPALEYVQLDWTAVSKTGAKPPHCIPVLVHSLSEQGPHLGRLAGEGYKLSSEGTAFEARFTQLNRASTKDQLNSVIEKGRSDEIPSDQTVPGSDANMSLRFGEKSVSEEPQQLLGSASSNSGGVPSFNRGTSSAFISTESSPMASPATNSPPEQQERNVLSSYQILLQQLQESNERIKQSQDAVQWLQEDINKKRSYYVEVQRKRHLSLEGLKLNGVVLQRTANVQGGGGE